MRVHCIDFTNAPKRKTPITCARCVLHDNLLCLLETRDLTPFERFEDSLRFEGPEIARIDFPFGWPRKLVQNLSWPLTWDIHVGLVGALSKQGCEEHPTDQEQFSEGH